MNFFKNLLKYWGARGAGEETQDAAFGLFPFPSNPNLRQDSFSTPLDNILVGILAYIQLEQDIVTPISSRRVLSFCTTILRS